LLFGFQDYNSISFEGEGFQGNLPLIFAQIDGFFCTKQFLSKESFLFVFIGVAGRGHL